MFDLITGTMERPLRERAPGSKVTSIVVHIVVLTLFVAIPVLRVTNNLPDIQTMMAFAAPPPEPPLPPPPPPPARSAAESRPVPQTAPKPSGQLIVPLETPTELRAEATTGTVSDGGVEGGVEGGVPGGVVGGIISPAPPAPPPPPAPVVVPVRVGGQISTPALVHRVEPAYPKIAAEAHVTGMVILEAIVGTDGCVESVKVLRSRHVLLDNAAMEALKQWRYTPLILNGMPTPFVLTVTFTFSAR
jgi:protein TonB